jgi:hypothetical protein
LEIRVTRPSFIGKYTRVVLRLLGLIRAPRSIHVVASWEDLVR